MYRLTPPADHPEDAARAGPLPGDVGDRRGGDAAERAAGADVQRGRPEVHLRPDEGRTTPQRNLPQGIRIMTLRSIKSDKSGLVTCCAGTMKMIYYVYYKLTNKTSKSFLQPMAACFDFKPYQGDISNL